MKDGGHKWHFRERKERKVLGAEKLITKTIMDNMHIYRCEIAIEPDL